MQHLNIDIEFKEILKEIKSENKNLSQWRAIESSDMFQSENYNGGFDATEDKFTFSYYSDKKQEFWFEFSLEELDEILQGKITQIKLRKTDY